MFRALVNSIVALLAYVAAVSAVAGVSTFNDFSTQTNVACAGFEPTNSQGTNIFAAAMADLSPLWVGARCEGTMNAANCNGDGSCVNCVGPACPDEEVCGECFNVKCTGSLDGETSGACTGNTIKVKIVDACPATHPANYCKIPEFGGTIRPIEACEATGVNALDIAMTARSQLSTFALARRTGIKDPQRRLNIHKQCLESATFGRLLWWPEPHEGEEVQLGDVGLMFDGAFCRLFNATVPADHPWNWRGVPEEFKHYKAKHLWTGMVQSDVPRCMFYAEERRIFLRTDVQMKQQEIPAKLGGGYRYEVDVSGPYRAVLVLRGPARNREVKLDKVLKQYIEANADRWQAFAQKHYACDRDELHFVYGCTKTSSWHITTFDPPEGTTWQVPTKVNVSVDAGGKVDVSRDGDRSVEVEHRCGPEIPSPDAGLFSTFGEPKEDQCVFMKTHSPTKKGTPSFIRRMLPAAGEHRSPIAEGKMDRQRIRPRTPQTAQMDSQRDVQIRRPLISPKFRLRFGPQSRSQAASRTHTL
ncbi:hypothetical protein NM688_g2048 [Phlebia brevispora]|uniref:Uncharacterized protein n=1 Tax=Phlebia brevispora TaxID=194682 RepID=A0ACC1T9Z6_9APHY|nr:hypothetical protein NM688_g2048 [Phlebia brevispora]